MFSYVSVLLQTMVLLGLEIFIGYGNEGVGKMYYGFFAWIWFCN